MRSIVVATAMEPATWPVILSETLSGSFSFDIQSDTRCMVRTEDDESDLPFGSGETSSHAMAAVFDDGTPWCRQWVQMNMGGLTAKRPPVSPSSRVIDGTMLGDFAVVVGVGANTALNAAKRFASEGARKAHLVLVPSSLATDSFLTNKYRGCGDSPADVARSGRYPNAVLIAMSLIRNAPLTVNRAGLGEAMALYSAVRDSALLAQQDTLDAAAAATNRILRIVHDSLGKTGDDAVSMETILALLVLKCIVMWAFADCRWGAGSEHKIAYSLDQWSRGNVLHGEGCAFGTWLMCQYLAQSRNSDVDPESLSRIFGMAKLRFAPSHFGLDKGAVARIIRKARRFRTTRVAMVDQMGTDERELMASAGMSDANSQRLL